MKKYNIGASILFIIIGIYVIQYTDRFKPVINGTPGPGFWPKILGCLLVVASSILLITSVFSKKEFKEQLIDFKSKGVKQVLKMFVVMILFGFLLDIIGFLPASLLFVIAVMVILGERSIKKISITSIAITISIYVIFAIALGLVLPRGKLFY